MLKLNVRLQPHYALRVDLHDRHRESDVTDGVKKFSELDDIPANRSPLPIPIQPVSQRWHTQRFPPFRSCVGITYAVLFGLADAKIPLFEVYTEVIQDAVHPHGTRAL